MSAIAMSMKVILFATFLILSTSADPVKTKESDVEAYVNTLRENLSSCREKYSKSKTNEMNLDDYTKHDLGCAVSCYFNKAGYMKNNKIDIEKAVATETIVYKDSMGEFFSEKKLKTIMDAFRKCANKINSKDFDDNCNMFVEMRQCGEEEMPNLSA